MEEKNLYNQVTIKNVDSEDFVFRVNKVPYLLRAGEARAFPKFMTVLAVKHLIDKVLNKKDPEGKLVARADARAEVARQIVLGEEKYERPQIPTDQQIVKEMNKPSDLDSVLHPKNTPVVVSPPPVVLPSVKPVVLPSVKPTVLSPVTPTVPMPVPMTDGTVIIDQDKTTTEKFDQVEEEKEFPTRKEMIKYGKDVLKLDVDSTEMKKRFSKLSDEQLYNELQIGK